MEKDVLEALDYNPGTGIFKWKVKMGSRALPGDIAGTLNHGYRMIIIKGKKYAAHRLAWFFYYGKLPDKNIDHINGNKDDNRIKNLRDVPQRKNCCNTFIHRGGKLAGTKLMKDMYRERPWVASIKINGKHNHIGVFKTELEAHEAYMKEYNKLESNA